MNFRSKTSLALILSAASLVLAACETAPTKSNAVAAQESADSERCMVTGSRLARPNCRDAGVGSISRESFERAQSDRASAPPDLTRGN
jgi:starvation-inducible outer membrane lipoprotein